MLKVSYLLDDILFKECFLSLKRKSLLIFNAHLVRGLSLTPQQKLSINFIGQKTCKSASFVCPFKLLTEIIRSILNMIFFT